LKNELKKLWAENVIEKTLDLLKNQLNETLCVLETKRLKKRLVY
jgi:hypothetical protein